MLSMRNLFCALPRCLCFLLAKSLKSKACLLNTTQPEFGLLLPLEACYVYAGLCCAARWSAGVSLCPRCAAGRPGGAALRAPFRAPLRAPHLPRSAHPPRSRHGSRTGARGGRVPRGRVPWKPRPRSPRPMAERGRARGRGWGRWRLRRRRRAGLAEGRALHGQRGGRARGPGRPGCCLRSAAALR